MTDANGNERFCFTIPCEFLVCVNTKTKMEAWHAIRSWFEAHSLFEFDVHEPDPAKQRKVRLDLSMLEARLKDSPGTIDVALNVKTNEVKLTGWSVPDNNKN